MQTGHKIGQEPNQLDHLFCDPELARGLRSCTVDAQPASEGLSDHALLVVEFEASLF